MMSEHNMNTTEILRHLVGFDTTSHKSNIAIIDWIDDYFQQLGISTTRIPNADGSKENILATIGPAGDNGLVLSGHTDVVPVADQHWTSDPFTLVERDGKLYGRGTCDMKGFVACALAKVPAMSAADLARPIHIALSYDEETGCFGVPSLIEQLPPAAAVIVGEPTHIGVVDNHKGVWAERVTCYGVSAHSSVPEMGVNAIQYAARALSEVERLGQKLREQIVKINDSVSTSATVNIGHIQGGTAHNIVADKCSFVWQLRCAPGQNPQPIVADLHGAFATLASEMQQHDARCRIDCEPLIEVPPFNADNNLEARDLALKLTGETQAYGVGYCTEAGFFAGKQYPTVVCGPGHIDQAHKPDEFIALSQLHKYEEFLDKLIAYCC